ncbi:MAG: hypothetical protein SGBAC_006543 [Bacillariaceae sp.]
MDFPSFLLECCHDNEYNDDEIYNDDDDDGISKGDLTDNDLSLSVQSTVASDIYATPERSEKRRTRQLPESPTSPINDNCNPNIYNTLSKSTSSTPIRCRNEEGDGYIKSKRRPWPVVVDIWEEQQQQKQEQQQQQQQQQQQISATKATPATAKTAAVSPFQDSSLDDHAAYDDCVDNSIALPHQTIIPQDDLFVADFGAMNAAATNSPQRDVSQEQQQQRKHFQRVLSFSSAAAQQQQQHQQQTPQESTVNVLPTPTAHHVAQTPTSQLEKQRERPLVPPSAVAGARRRMLMIPLQTAEEAVATAAEEKEQTTINMSTQEDPIEAPLDEHERKSVVSALVAKMNAASSAFTATTATLSSKFVHENSREDQDDEWSQDSLLNLTDDEGNGGGDRNDHDHDHDLALVEESFTDLQKNRKQDAFELFPRHENIFVEPGAQAAIINMAEAEAIATEEKEEEKAIHEPGEAVDEVVVGGMDSGDDDDEFDEDFEEDSEGLPIIFDDEFGDLPEGAIFDEEDFGFHHHHQQQQQQQQHHHQSAYGIHHHQEQPSTTLSLASPKEEQEQKQGDEALVVSSSKSNKKKKKKKGGSFKKKFTNLLQRNKVDYGSLEDSFEKSNNKKKELPQLSTTTVTIPKKAPASVPVKKVEAASVPIVKPEVTPISVPTRTTGRALPPAVTTVQSEDSFAMINDPWSTETTTAAFPIVKTEPTKLTVVQSPPASPIKQSKLDTPPIYNAVSLSPKKGATAAGGAPSWEQLLTSVLENNNGGGVGETKEQTSTKVASNDPWMIPDSDTFEAQKDQEQDELMMTAPIDALPYQFTNEFFSKPEASSSPEVEEAGDQEAGSQVNIPLDITEQRTILEESSPTIDTATAIRPSQVIPKRRVTGVNNTKAIFESSTSASAASKRSLQLKRTSNLVSPDKELPQDAAAIGEEVNKPSVQDLTDAFDKERSPKWVNRKVKAWEQTSEKTEPPTPTRKSRVAIRVVSGGGDSTQSTARSASLPKRGSIGLERSNVALASKDLTMPPKARVNVDGERGTTVQDLTDAFDTERTPMMVNRKVKAFERGHASEKPETSTRRSKVAIHVVDKTRSSSLTKQDSRGADGEAERSDVRSSSLTKRVPPKSSPPLPSKPVQPVNPIEVPRKEKDSTLETTTRRSSNVGQMASIFDPPTVSKKNVNKLAGAFEKDTKVFHKSNRIPSNNKTIMGERPVVKRSFSSNAIPPAKATGGPTPRVPKRASVVTPTNAERTSSTDESSSTGTTKKLFSYWEQVAVTTKSTPMPSAEEENAVVAVDEQGSNKDMGVDVSFDFSDPDYESSGVPTVDEKAWAKASSNQPESATIFSL